MLPPYLDHQPGPFLFNLASDLHLDLGRAPYCYGLYGVKYIDPVSPAPARALSVQPGQCSF